jgi:hypothetical protein
MTIPSAPSAAVTASFMSVSAHGAVGDGMNIITTEERKPHSDFNSWRTPQYFYDQINAWWHFDFDPCPPSPTFDGLYISWGKRCFVNPPYGKNQRVWIEKALAEIKAGHTEIAVFLINVRTDAEFFHDLILPNASEIIFIRGGLKFVPPNTRRIPVFPFPSMLVVFTSKGGPPEWGAMIQEGRPRKSEDVKAAIIP